MENGKQKKDIKKDENKEKIMDLSSMEVGEDATKYGEFISSYFAWISLPEQKEKAIDMENMTKDKKDKKDKKDWNFKNYLLTKG